MPPAADPLGALGLEQLTGRRHPMVAIACCPCSVAAWLWRRVGACVSTGPWFHRIVDPCSLAECQECCRLHAAHLAAARARPFYECTPLHAVLRCGIGGCSFWLGLSREPRLALRLGEGLFFRTLHSRGDDLARHMPGPPSNMWVHIQASRAPCHACTCNGGSMADSIRLSVAFALVGETSRWTRAGVAFVCGCPRGGGHAAIHPGGLVGFLVVAMVHVASTSCFVGSEWGRLFLFCSTWVAASHRHPNGPFCMSCLPGQAVLLMMQFLDPVSCGAHPFHLQSSHAIVRGMVLHWGWCACWIGPGLSLAGFLFIICCPVLT